MKTFNFLRNEAKLTGLHLDLDANHQKAKELMSPAKHREDGINRIQTGMKVSKTKATEYHDNVMKAHGYKPEGKAYGPTGISYYVPTGHPDEVDPKTKERYSSKAQKARSAQARMDKKFGPGGSYSKGADQVRKVIAKEDTDFSKTIDIVRKHSKGSEIRGSGDGTTVTAEHPRGQYASKADRAAHTNMLKDKLKHLKSVKVVHKTYPGSATEANMSDLKYDADVHSNRSMTVKKKGNDIHLHGKSYHSADDHAKIAKKMGMKVSNHTKTFGGTRTTLTKESLDEVFRKRPRIFEPKPDDSPERTAMIKSVQKSMAQRKARLAKAKKDRQTAWAAGKPFDTLAALGYKKAIEANEDHDKTGYKIKPSVGQKLPLSNAKDIAALKMINHHLDKSFDHKPGSAEHSAHIKQIEIHKAKMSSAGRSLLMMGEGTYQVDIEGLPKMFMSSDNPGQLRRDLRKIVRKVDMVNDVKRIQKSDVRKHLQLKLQGKDEEETNEAHSTKDILKMFPKPSKFSDKEVKMAKGIAFDKRYKGGDMDGAVRAQDKIKKGLSDHPAVARANRAANEAAVEYPHAMYHPKTGEKVMAKTPADHNKYNKIGYVHDDPKKEIDERDLSSRQKNELEFLQMRHKHFSNISSNPIRKAEHDKIKKRIGDLGHKPDVISKNEGFFWVIKEDQIEKDGAKIRKAYAKIATEDMDVVTSHLKKHGIEHEHDRGELYVRRQDHRDVLNHLNDLIKDRKIKHAPPVTAEKKDYKKSYK